ncbi:DUF3419 family protein [Sphingobacterium olei]|uniref:DUF3419 family protein n=1 Tax=Sphingobacterium olei TaxID=2571155 RepID=A0A4U0P231_9SPHI|nr:DUF3419 family protein [Sphingobacterium olei]TJZ61347.1 DUF3419 family protein [Sphingobacterium olei]
MGNLSTQVDFNRIRYANCWEDPHILLKGLLPAVGSKILSIGSAGDNSFSLLTTSPSLVVAVDVNPIQLHLIELKKQAIRNLEYEQVLHFLGFRQGMNRVALFEQCKDRLNAEARVYWVNNTDKIEKGLIHQGKFERYFQMFSSKVLPFIHSRHDVEELLASKDAPSQARYYHEKWNTWRWRFFFKIFFSKIVMGTLGRDPQFLKEVGVHVSDYIFKKAERHLKKVQAQTNLFLRYNLTGTFGDLLPHYLHPDNYQRVKENVDKLILRSGFAEDVVDEFGSFDAMNLSNIFEYMDRDVFRKTADSLLKGLNANGRMAYWNLMVPRRVSGIFPSEIQYLSTLSTQLSREDNGFFYNQFIVDQK